MELRQPCAEKVLRLIEKGVKIPNPLTIDIGEEVSVDRVSGQGVRIYPGCRIYGEKTVISAGTQIGYEGPVTIENCQIGPKVELKGGYFSRSVFLRGSSMEWERRSGRPASWKKRRAEPTAWGLSRPSFSPL